MVMTRHYVRAVRLADSWDPAAMPFKAQWSVLGLFLVCFVLAVGVVWYMLKLYFRSKPVA